MKLKALAVASVLAAAATFAPHAASAASLPAPAAQQSRIADGGLLQDVGHRRWHHANRCRIVRHECADHFGWGSWRFRRCVMRHGCARW
ncbi:hypothetical protein [Hyphomicrobium zavarzinii]|uniref:hypothetical protein n=1 Tax=Hyphomicrobium zavarzinii TaxID=48292 RepID=UPI000380F1A8|nr:hypothetical protein [Hyphomicrobium zavarzinii]